ncbi:hypothetical protein N5S72_10040 [Aliarcobacter cryaerophilus]|uniref:hypothetical protein n=1 Tax=Aliarcobacter cryaerophilus TaxID=28198 RepID=UPI0021B3AE1C|nr:hypothetical protein [Aliarcobacter cryaerophilus]MCT7464789.1 hypothetical protein [Aliarcobacter cryaerophilus]
MRTINFKITFLSDIVLHGSSNTEGNIETLDFITGSSLLGIVAKNYDKFEDQFSIFHSGKVRFGEATPYLVNKPTYKVPFCFFAPKLDSDKKEVKNNHYINYTDVKELDKQYKQLRTGYITSALDYFHLDYSYLQKSAYDKENRRSKDSSMFGYKAIKQGTTWKFNLKFDDSITTDVENKICEYIVGTRYLGKSKNAQFGQILIEELKDYKEENLEDLTIKDTTYVYINSSLALFNENGMPTFEPTSKNLGLKNAVIDWENTQIRTKKFTPYNFKRQTNDYSRLVIEKGSVIALKKITQEDIATLKNGIGGYLSEGYGEVLINPKFLMNENCFCLNKIEQSENKKIEKEETSLDNILVSFLDNKNKAKNQTYDLGKKVQEFIDENKKKFKKVSKSQWGQIRVLTQFHKKDKLYIEKIKDFISNGISKKQWDEGQKTFFHLLETESNDFIKLLSMMMPKIKVEDNEND